MSELGKKVQVLFDRQWEISSPACFLTTEDPDVALGMECRKSKEMAR